ncbi:MAG TPA: lysine decarboxylase [Planctomycetaceae bacterium]|nr:lysine decarboxylase [Planctomycetaceae bacterium]
MNDSSTHPLSTTSNVPLSNEAAVEQILGESILGLWDVVNNLTRIRTTRDERYRVTIFGSARTKPGSLIYEETRRCADALAELGCDIVTGGGPGLMQAANEGAAGRGGVQSIGIRVDLPFEQGANAFVQQMFQHRTFFTRLHQFVLASDAFLVAPGGIGTLLEVAMIWQLLQVRHITDMPLILMGPMWPGLIEWARESMLVFDPPLCHESDLRIPQCVPDAEAAIALIRTHYEQWQLANV